MIQFLITWQLLIIPLLVLIISQFVKAVSEQRTWKITWKQLNSYGGMPSTHTAFLVSMVMMSALVVGIDKPITIGLLFIAAIFIRDAMGIRWELGFHGKILNRLIRELDHEERRRFPARLEERLGHTPREVLAGACVGIALTILLYLLIANV